MLYVIVVLTMSLSPHHAVMSIKLYLSEFALNRVLFSLPVVHSTTIHCDVYVGPKSCHDAFVVW